MHEHVADQGEGDGVHNPEAEQEDHLGATHAEADVVQAATAAGYKDIYKKTLIGIGELEKLMGKDQFRSILGQYVTKPHGKLTLVPESDRREAVTASTAQEDFGGKGFGPD